MSTDELSEVYHLETLEQMRAIADDLRLRIVDALASHAMTVTQLGERLGQSPAKVHYHVRELERVGLVRLVETREKGGILEKYYRTVAKSLVVSRHLMSQLPSDDALATLSAFLRILTEGALDAWRREMRDQQGGTQLDVLMGATLWATEDERREIVRKVRELIAPYEEARGIPGERENIFAQLTFAVPPEQSAPDAQDAADDGDALEQSPRTASTASAASAASAPSRRRRVFVTGGLTYTRTDLERAVARGKLLDITVLGTCVFADDVTPELVDRAIQRFRLLGALSASPEVRAALKRKERPATG
jgi:DNA-binding transcriptional ArsR family regulator